MACSPKSIRGIQLPQFFFIALRLTALLLITATAPCRMAWSQDLPSPSATLLEHSPKAVRLLVGGVSLPTKSLSWLFGTDLGFTSTLFMIDVNSTDLTTVGDTGFSDVSDIAFLPDGRLFGTRFTFFDTDLIRIDPKTAATTRVGSGIGFDGINALVAESANTLFGGSLDGELIRIDVNTGIGTRIGFFGSGLSSTGDLALDSDNRLYGVAHFGVCCTQSYLVEINKSTGAAIVIGEIGFDNVFGLAFRQDGTLYAVANGDRGQIPSMIVLNKTTGAGSFLGSLPTSDGMGGLAVDPAVIFLDGFESGNTLAWSSSVP